MTHTIWICTHRELDGTWKPVGPTTEQPGLLPDDWVYRRYGNRSDTLRVVPWQYRNNPNAWIEEKEK